MLILIIILIILWSVGYYTFASIFTPWVFYEGHTTSMKIVNFDLSTGHIDLIEKSNGRKEAVFVPDPPHIGNHIKFKVPKSYLTMKEEWKGGSVDSFSLEATYPDFKPWYAEYAKSKNKLDKHRGKIYLTIKMGKDYLLSRVTSSRKGRLEKQNQIVYGLEYYKEKGDLKPNGTREPLSKYASDHYFTHEDIEPAMEIDCPSFAFSENVRCGVDTDYNKDIYINYSFVRKDLANWKEVDANVRKFISSIMFLGQHEGLGEENE